MIRLLPALCLVLSACTGAPQPVETVASVPPPPEPDAMAILATLEQDFVKVNHAPLKSPIHGGVYDLWVDKAHASQYKGVGETAPAGMTVVKQELPAGGRLYLMQKLQGYDSANRDWFYAKATGKTLETVGRATTCIDCHQAYKRTDYLAVPSVDYGRAIL